MPNRNRNQRSQAWSSQEWDQNRQRPNRDYDYDQNRGRRNFGGSSYENTNYGYSNTNRNREMDNPAYDENYGNMGQETGSQYNQDTYGNYNQSQGGWSGQDHWGSGGSYAQDYNRGNWRERQRMNPGSYGQGSGYGESTQGSDYGGQWNRRSMYGGDTSNYGNMNQGGYDRGWWDKTRDEVSSWFGDDEAERRRRMDRQMTGSKRGKGPKGYQRSDDRIKEDINDELTDNDYIDASDIEVKVENCNVILTGTVESRDEKHRAEDIAENVLGVQNVENRLRVNSERSSSSTGAGTSGQSATTPGSTMERKKTVTS
ncbi:MAG TPA: BON domain-containing protein [Chitinophagaceae bacterium]|nr:BON domain-containing protein [Chitinophagaceae bacterium]